MIMIIGHSNIFLLQVFILTLENFESQLDLCSDAEDIGSLKQVSEGMMI